MTTCLQKCVTCGEWTVEVTEPRNSYRCPACRARARELAQQVREYDAEIASIKAQLRALGKQA